uniref:RING-type domain-containing protein n=1 Tax=Cyanoderma ruficeps TaxID=181631 RepID=A0A8C3RFI9_9PASS
MATEMGSNCAICQDTWDDVACTVPCGHHFCRGCILQWAQTNPSRPLCRRTMETVRFSDDAGDYLEVVVTAPEQLPAAMSQISSSLELGHLTAVSQSSNIPTFSSS